MKSSPKFFGVALLISTSISPAIAERITAEDAKNHISEKTTVCGKVANEYTAASSHGAPTFIDLDSAYPKRIFTAVIWGNDKQAVGELPSVGSKLCVTGLIENYRGTPEIAVWSREQFSQ